MIAAYTGTGVRAAEAPLLADGQGPQLMQRAAYGLSRAVLADLRKHRGSVYGASVTALVGRGNNGADALYALAFLAARGVRITAVLTSGKAFAPALSAFTAAGGRLLEQLPPRPDVLIDGVLGTGAKSSGSPAGIIPAAAFRSGTAAPEPETRVIACDLPSGIDADTGELLGPVLRADLTVTFGAAKTGLLVEPGAGYAGEVQVVDIGIGSGLGEPDLQRFDAGDLRALLPVPGRGSHKYSRGVLGVIAGSEEYPGAAVLTVRAALAAGVGMVRFYGPEPVRRLVVAECPEVVCHAGLEGRVQAWAVGPGVGKDEGQHGLIREALAGGLPVVADASALAPDTGGNAGTPKWGSRTVLTPHAGELSALLAGAGVDAPRTEIEAAPLRWARRAAEVLQATVLLKGPATVVSSPGSVSYSQDSGSPYLATAGSGDTLTGILGALLATSDRTPAEAAALAAYVHGLAGRRAAAEGPFGASALADYVRAVLADV